MLVSTQGIVLRTLKYTDNSLIADILTPDYGILGFIINGIHSAKAAVKPAHLQMGSLLDIIAYFKPEREIHRLKEIRLNHLYLTLDQQPAKSAIVLFACEVLQLCTRDAGPQEAIYKYARDFLISLDAYFGSIGGHALMFQAGLASHLGLVPELNRSPDEPYFSIPAGRFTAHKNELGGTGQNEISEELLRLFRSADNPSENSTQVDAGHKAQLFKILNDYFLHHVPGYRTPKSLGVLADLSEGLRR